MKKKSKRDSTLANWLGDEVKRMPPDELADALDAIYAHGPEQATVDKARAAAQARLEEAMPPVIYYALMEKTPLGPVWIAIRGRTLVAISYGGSEADFLKYINKLMDGRFRADEGQLAEVSQDLSEYLAGERQDFELDVDLSYLTAFQRAVLEETARVPRGQVASYAEIAKRIGKPKASRAVGQALRNNPIPIVVPCHRVVASDGSLGGYAGQMGDERKIKLLKLEGVVFA